MKWFVRGMFILFIAVAVIGCDSSGGDDDDAAPADGDAAPPTEAAGSGSFTVQGYAAQDLVMGWTEDYEGDLDLYLYSATPDPAAAQDFINLTLNTSTLAAGTYTTADGSLLAGNVGVDLKASSSTYTFLGYVDDDPGASASTLTVSTSGSEYTLSFTLNVYSDEDPDTNLQVTGTYSGTVTHLD